MIVYALVMCVLCLMSFLSYGATLNVQSYSSQGDSVQSTPRGLYKSKIIPSRRLDSLMHVDTCKRNYFHPYIMPDKDFDTLTIEEKLIYAMAYPEAYAQICSSYPSHDRSPGSKYQWVPTSFFQGEGVVTSQRQIEALQQHRDSVVQMLDSAISQERFDRVRMLTLVVYLTAIECIPTVVALIKEKEGNSDYAITCLMLLMREKNYTAFVSTDIYRKTYERENLYERSVYLKTEEIKLIKQLAMRFYREEMKKK